MSRTAAPVGEVMTPMRFGSAGNGRLRSAANKALGGEPLRELLELALQGAEAGILHVIDDELVFAARLVQPDARPHQHLLAVAAVNVHSMFRCRNMRSAPGRRRPSAKNTSVPSSAAKLEISASSHRSRNRAPAAPAPRD
jgi:hypothetical protein